MPVIKALRRRWVARAAPTPKNTATAMVASVSNAEIAKKMIDSERESPPSDGLVEVGSGSPRAVGFVGTGTKVEFTVDRCKLTVVPERSGLSSHADVQVRVALNRAWELTVAGCVREANRVVTVVSVGRRTTSPVIPTRTSPELSIDRAALR